jgi:hypothetical protein
MQQQPCPGLAWPRRRRTTALYSAPNNKGPPPNFSSSVSFQPAISVGQGKRKEAEMDRTGTVLYLFVIRWVGHAGDKLIGCTCTIHVASRGGAMGDFQDPDPSSTCCNVLFRNCIRPQKLATQYYDAEYTPLLHNTHYEVRSRSRCFKLYRMYCRT